MRHSIRSCCIKTKSTISFFFIAAMNPCEISSQSFFFFIVIIIFLIAFTPSVSPYSHQAISYSDHCSSFVPEAFPTDWVSTRYPFLEPVTSHYTGGQQILGQGSSSQRSILFSPTHNLFKTNITDTYKIQARLSFTSSNIYHYPSNFTYYGGRSNYSRIARRRRLPLTFFLNGFWSVSTEKLCMVGSARWYSTEGNLLQLDAVLKLKFARMITLVTSLVSGILESLASPDDSGYFEPISMLGFPRVAPFKYNYTLVSDEECHLPGARQDSSISMHSIDACSTFVNQFRTYQLEYPSSCTSTENCNLFGQARGFTPSFVSLYGIQCSWMDKKLRFLLEFQDRRYTPYDQSFNPNITLIGEGTWNGTEDRLCIVACQILNQSDPLGGAHVGDCSIRLSLWYPAVRSIKNTHSTEGQIWTNKTADDIGYFETIKFQSFSHSSENYGARYEFTQMEKVRQFCPAKKGAKRGQDEYPEGNSRDMTFDMLVAYKNAASTGFAVPIFVGDQVYNSYSMLVSNYSWWQAAMPPVVVSTASRYQGPTNISYEISFTPNISSISTGRISSLNLSATHDGRVDISAEGVYDGETGRLCMVGCRKLGLSGKNSTSDSMDCEILVKFQLPNGKNGSFIKGSIESLRGKRDVLYFERLDVLSLTYTESAARKSIWRMDLEIIMVLVSGTLACVFIARQIFHVKKRPEMVPFVSVLTMVVLTLGHMVPLVLNFEALFLNTRNQNSILLGGSGGWLEGNEVVVRIVTMVAFLLQSRLLQLTWTAKASYENANGKNPWIPEIRALLVCAPTYIVGGSAAMLLNWKNDDYAIESQRSIWGDLRSYAGLTLDGFLFPQLVLNVFQISKGPALARSFYLGTTFVRLLPHAYDLYRGPKSIIHQFDRFYIYANPRTDFYSPSWDIAIAGGGMAFAVIIFLQQHFGGRFMFPKRFRQPSEHEMVPVASSQ